jgi:hypothetical protein
MKTERAGKEKCFVDKFFNFIHHFFHFPLCLVLQNIVQTIVVIRCNYKRGLVAVRSWCCVNDSGFFVLEPAACGKKSLRRSQSRIISNNVMRNVGRDKETWRGGGARL